MQKNEPISLRDSSEFQTERHKEIVSVLNIMSTHLSLPLYFLFWIADWILAPERVWQFLGLRLTIVPVALFINRFLKKSRTTYSAQLLASLFLFWNAFLISIMIFILGNHASPYYAGLNLVGFAGISFIPWDLPFTALCFLLVYGPYLAYATLVSLQTGDWRHATINIFFIFSTVVISSGMRWFNNILRKREFVARRTLGVSLEEREETIRLKTQEAIGLKSLSRQFSPQIVHAISSGKLRLDENVHRSNICAIFIDCVNSTQRIVRLDKDSINAVISKFMDDTMKTLIKYDITIDKFLGDGILGFSNDPMRHPDYIQRTALAAFEILDRINKNRNFYEDHWLSEFTIRIGIASGFANVGFYGNSEVYKTYTAIGPVMNLASRLCAEAKPNSIVVSNDVKKVLAADPEFSCTPLGPLKLKGFEEDLIKGFQLHRSLESTGNGISKNLEICPACGQLMHVDVNGEGHYIFRCRNCESAGTSNKKAA